MDLFLFLDVWSKQAGIHHLLNLSDIFTVIGKRPHHYIIENTGLNFSPCFFSLASLKQGNKFIENRIDLHLTCNMVLSRNLHILKELINKLSYLKPFLYFWYSLICTSSILFHCKELSFNDIVIWSDCKINEIIVNPLFFTMLDSQFEHLYSFRIDAFTFVKDYRFKIVIRSRLLV